MTSWRRLNIKIYSTNVHIVVRNEVWIISRRHAIVKISNWGSFGPNLYSSIKHDCQVPLFFVPSNFRTPYLNPYPLIFFSFSFHRKHGISYVSMPALYTRRTANCTLQLIQCNHIEWKVAQKLGEYECISEKKSSHYFWTFMSWK